MKRYPFLRVGQLLTTKTAIRGPIGVRVLTLLVDTGSTYTIVPQAAIESVGHALTGQEPVVNIVTGNGYIRAPRIGVDWIQALGKKVRGFQVVVHTLPVSRIPIDGLLGMDFLTKVEAKLDLSSGEAEIP